MLLIPEANVLILVRPGGMMRKRGKRSGGQRILLINKVNKSRNVRKEII